MASSPSLGHSSNLAAWNNFHSVASAQERAENDRLQREHAARKEEEQRTGIRRGPQYTFNETWKQVHLGENPTQRDMSGMTHSAVSASPFGAAGSLPTGPAPRGSRFFPSPVTHPIDERRSATYSYSEPPGSPSPPPAEEYASAHPAFDGDQHRPAVRFPRERAVVKLPPSSPLTPPAEPHEEKPSQPMTWAARAAMASQPQLRAVSTPIAQTPSWQERFNGLFDRKLASQRSAESQPSPAVEISSRELLEVMSPTGASVSLPVHASTFPQDEAFIVASKEVEEEEDLFEDRELASLPTISLPLQPLVSLPLALKPRMFFQKGLEVTSGDPSWMHFPRGGQYAIVRAPGTAKSTKVNLPSYEGAVSHSSPKYPKTSGKRGGFNGRGKARTAAKAA